MERVYTIEEIKSIVAPIAAIHSKLTEEAFSL